jgi:hypothetical protein
VRDLDDEVWSEMRVNIAAPLGKFLTLRCVCETSQTKSVYARRCRSFEHHVVSMGSATQVEMTYTDHA